MTVRVSLQNLYFANIFLTQNIFPRLADMHLKITAQTHHSDKQLEGRVVAHWNKGNNSTCNYTILSSH